MLFFYGGLFLLSGATLMYEVVLTRLLSVVCWYYLAFVSVSMAMFGMTAGSLWVHFRPQHFATEAIPRRLSEAALAMAISLPLALVMLLAIPVEISYSAETIFSFLLFTAVISVPFYFSGVAVCVALTRSPYPIGRVYGADLAGAALGCLGAIGLLEVLDAPSAILAISGAVFVAAAAFEAHAGEKARSGRRVLWALALLFLAFANSTTLHGIQPIWTKGKIDTRRDLLAEVWNPISKVRLAQITGGQPYMWGASPRMPQMSMDYLFLDIDNDAATPMYRYQGDRKDVAFLLFDVTSLAVQLRPGGSAAIIGMGGGRDVLAAVTQNFHRIVGIEVNDAIVDLALHRFGWYSGLPSLSQLEVHRGEGRSYLTATSEKFDVIQASMVDTWAATSAGALTLTENGLYTVDAWRILYEHLKPGGLLTCSRWNSGAESAQTQRQFSLAAATLFSEGVANPGEQMALIGSGRIATLLVSNRPLSAEDLNSLRRIDSDLQFVPLYLPGEPPADPTLKPILAARSVADLEQLRDLGDLDLSPTYDSAPFFFNFMRLSHLPILLQILGTVGNLRALAFLFCFLVAAVLLLIAVVIVPLVLARRRVAVTAQARGPLLAGMIYFVAIGLGFMLVEMAFMQQLSIFLGEPIYSLSVVLGGLILASGAGSLLSGVIPAASKALCRIPALAAGACVAAMSVALLPLIHRFAALVLWQRAALSFAFIAPCGLLMGGCFPVGLERMRRLGQDANLPWMWALNGCASVLASFLAIIVSMESSLTAAALLGAGCYAIAAVALPWTGAIQPLQNAPAR